MNTAWKHEEIKKLWNCVERSGDEETVGVDTMDTRVDEETVNTIWGGEEMRRL